MGAIAAALCAHSAAAFEDFSPGDGGGAHLMHSGHATWRLDRVFHRTVAKVTCGSPGSGVGDGGKTASFSGAEFDVFPARSPEAAAAAAAAAGESSELEALLFPVPSRRTVSGVAFLEVSPLDATWAAFRPVGASSYGVSRNGGISGGRRSGSSGGSSSSSSSGGGGPRCTVRAESAFSQAHLVASLGGALLFRAAGALARERRFRLSCGGLLAAVAALLLLAMFVSSSLDRSPKLKAALFGLGALGQKCDKHVAVPISMRTACPFPSLTISLLHGCSVCYIVLPLAAAIAASRCFLRRYLWGALAGLSLDGLLGNRWLLAYLVLSFVTGMFITAYFDRPAPPAVAGGGMGMMGGGGGEGGMSGGMGSGDSALSGAVDLTLRLLGAGLAFGGCQVRARIVDSWPPQPPVLPLVAGCLVYPSKLDSWLWCWCWCWWWC